jgi:citrate lyase subunit beta/citryl-CoA lyase
MRSLLFVPGDSERKLARGVTSGADVLIIDLEDSVAMAQKARARDVAAAFLNGLDRTSAPDIHVRINDLESGLAEDDLAALMPARPTAIMLPKSVGIASVEALSAALRVHEARCGIADGRTAILPLVTETARGLFAAATFGTGHPRVCGLTWGAEDLSADIGAQATRDENGRLTDVFRLARGVALLSAAACSTAAIDTVFVDFHDAEGLRAECAHAVRDGFVGKLAIHPDQVPTINAAFTPSPSAIAEATAIVEAFAEKPDVGVVAIHGRMYDLPHRRRAERLLARAGVRRSG